MIRNNYLESWFKIPREPMPTPLIDPPRFSVSGTDIHIYKIGVDQANHSRRSITAATPPAKGVASIGLSEFRRHMIP